MSGAALAFMIGSWASVLSLTAWCFTRVLRAGGPRPGGPGSADGSVHPSEDPVAESGEESKR